MKTNDLRAAAQAALEAMDALHRTGDTQVFDLCHRETTEALRAALAEPEVQSTHSAECYKWHHECARAEVERLRAALAEPDHSPNCALLQVPSRDCDCRQENAEPVAWMVYTEDGKSVYVTDNPTDIKVEQRALPLYTAPPRREWQGLTDKDFDAIHKRVGSMGYEYERAIEAALREKNT